MFTESGICLDDNEQNTQGFWGITISGRPATALISTVTRHYMVTASNCTPEGYNLRTVQKILAAKESKKVKIPADKKGFFAWLKDTSK